MIENINKILSIALLSKKKLIFLNTLLYPNKNRL